MFLYIITLHSDINASFNSLLNFSLRGIRYVIHTHEDKSLETSLQMYYETFLQTEYKVRVHFFKLDDTENVEEYYINGYDPEKKIDMYSNHLDEELDSHFNYCNMTDDEFNKYIKYVKTKIEYSIITKEYNKKTVRNKKELLNSLKQLNCSFEEINKVIEVQFKHFLDLDKNDEPIKDAPIYLYKFNDYVYVKKCAFTQLTSKWLPEVKSIQPIIVENDMSLSFTKSDLTLLLNEIESKGGVSEQQQQPQEAYAAQEGEVQEGEQQEGEESDDTPFNYDNYFIFSDPEKNFEFIDITDKYIKTEIEYDADKPYTETVYDTDTILKVFLDFFTTNLVVNKEIKEDLCTLPIQYVEDEFCYFVLNPKEYVFTLCLHNNSQELRTFLNKLNNLIKPDETSIDINILLNQAKTSFSTWCKVQPYLNLQLRIANNYRKNLYDKIMTYNNQTSDEHTIKNIIATVYELSIHTTIKHHFWKFSEQTKKINQHIIKSLITLFKYSCIGSNSDKNNILSSHLYNEFLGYLKFYNFHFYIPHVSNVTFTVLMKKLGFKIKRSSAGNVYENVELQETFHKDWMENFTIKNHTVVEEVLPYEIDMFSSLKKKRFIQYAFEVPEENLPRTSKNLDVSNAKDYAEKSM